MKKNSTDFRQGDVALRKTNNVDKKGYKLVTGKNSRILAYGEVTGHHHSINLLNNVKLFKNEKGIVCANILDENLDTANHTRLYRNAAGRMILEIDEGKAVLVHQEHAPIILEPGIYESEIQTEYDPEGDIRVKD